MIVFSTIFAILLASFHRGIYVLNRNPQNDHLSNSARHRATSMSYIRVITISLAWSLILLINIAIYWPVKLKTIPLYHGLFTFSFNILSFFLIFLIFGLILLLLTNSFAYVLTYFNNSKTSSETPKTSSIASQIKKGGNIKESSILLIGQPQGCTTLEYIIILLFSLIGGLFLMSSNDLFSLFISLELQSYGLYLLAVMNRKHSLSTSAGLKYFLLGGLSSSFILLGCVIIYMLTGLTNIEAISLLLSVIPSDVSAFWTSLTLLGFEGSLPSYRFGICGAILIILIGFLFKISAAPFHNWSPDVYDGVPTLVTSWLTIIPKISLIFFFSNFLVLLPIYSSQNLNFIEGLQHYPISYFLLISSFLSLTIGSLLGLTQTRIKRLFAFSSISNIGFILLSLGILTVESINTVMFYLIQYSIANLNVFFIIISFGYLLFPPSLYSFDKSTLDRKVIIKDSKVVMESYPNPHHFYSTSRNNLSNEINSEGSSYSPISLISQLKGQWYNNSYLVLSFVITLFSLAGIPPLIGFYGKLLVIFAALNNGYYLLTFIAIITSVISAAYYLNIVKVMFSSDSETDTIIKPTSIRGFTASVILPQEITFIISILTLLICFFIFKPELLLNATHILAFNLFIL